MTQDRIRTAWKSIFHQKKCKIFVTVIKCCEHNKKKAVLSVASVQCVPKKWDKVFKNGPSKICGRQPFNVSLSLVFWKTEVLGNCLRFKVRNQCKSFLEDILYWNVEYSRWTFWILFLYQVACKKAITYLLSLSYSKLRFCRSR